MTKQFMAAAVAGMLAFNMVVGAPAAVKAEVADMQEMSSEDISSEKISVTENMEAEDVTDSPDEADIPFTEAASEETEETSAPVEEIPVAEAADTEETVSLDALEDVTVKESPVAEYTFISMEEYDATCMQDTDDWKAGVYQGTGDVVINFICDVSLDTPLQVPNAKAVVNIAGNFTTKSPQIGGKDMTIDVTGETNISSATASGNVVIDCDGDFYLNSSLTVTGDAFSVNADNIYLNGYMQGSAKTEAFHAKSDIHVEDAGFVISACDYYLHAEGTTYLSGDWQGAAPTSVLHFNGNALEVIKDGSGMYGASFDLNTINLETDMEIGGFGSTEKIALVPIQNATINTNGHTLAVCRPDISNCSFIGNGGGTGLSTNPGRKVQTENQSSGSIKDTCFTGYQTAVSVISCKLDITNTDITGNGIEDLSSADVSQGIYIDISGKINASGLTVKNAGYGVNAAHANIFGQVAGENPEDKTGITIKDSSFEDVLIGIRGGGYINHCSIKGGENAEAGIKFSNGYGSLIINSTIEGFEYGIYSGRNSCNGTYDHTAYLLGNCKITNVDIGCLMYQGEMHACEISAGKTGVYCGADVAITDSKITGTKAEGSKGIISASAVQVGTRKDGVLVYPSGYEGRFLDSSRNGHTFTDTTLALLDSVREGNEISGFDTGYVGAGTGDHYGFIKVHDCNIGIMPASGSNYASDDVEIYNCNIGLSGNHYGELRWAPYQTDHVNIYIHGCETGITNTTLWMNESDKDNHLLEIYDCTDAVINSASGGYMGNTYIHDCERGLSCLSGSLLLSSDFLVVDCADKNLYYASGMYIHMTDYNTNLRSINNVGGYAVYIEDGIMTDSDDLMLAPKTWETKGVIYLGEGSRFNVRGKAPSNISQYTGSLLLDFNEYKEGRLVFQGAGGSGTSYNLKLDDGEYYDPDTVYDFNKLVWTPYSDTAAPESLYDQHRIFTVKEGWVVVPETVEQTFALPVNDTDSVPVSEIKTNKGTVKTKLRTGNLILAAGCNVTYDYETNGGSSFSGDANIISYKAKADINMGYTASRAGYTFVGWSASPNAKAASTAIIAGTKNITLYAIFKKEVPVTYHTENGTYEDVVTFYNNDDTLVYDLDAYQEASYSIAGYTLDNTDKDNLLKEGEEVSVTPCGLDVYCVYEKYGHIIYLDENGVFYSADSITDTFTAEDTEAKVFHYPLMGYEVAKGHVFNGWYDVTDADKAVINSGVYATDSSNVTVRALVDEKTVGRIEVTPKQAAIDVDESFKLEVTITPDDAYNKAVTWYSGDETIATVDQAGKVVGKKPGVVRIYAKTKDGSDVTDYSEITVKQYAVHYDYETNGGMSMDEVGTNYVLHEAINVNVKAYKPDYRFVGWNTDKDAKTGLPYLTESGKEITLYAIYKKTIDVTYHTYRKAGNYTDTITLYNKETDIAYILLDFEKDASFQPAGYILSPEITADTMIYQPNDTINIQGTADVYYIYRHDGNITYLDEAGNVYAKESTTSLYVADTVTNAVFTHHLKQYQAKSGYTFSGWEYKGKQYQADTDLTTNQADIVVKAAATKNADEPTTGEPDIIPDELVIEDPTKEPDKSKPNDKAPKTGDENYPLETAIMMSGAGAMLLFLYLLMKKKK